MIWAQLVVSGLAAGGLYALIALGMTLIYKTTNVLNFAQGQMAMVSTFFAYTLMTTLNLSFWMTLGLTIVFAAVLGLAIERICLRPIMQAPPISIAIVTLGLFLVLSSVASLIWGHRTVMFPSPFAGVPVRLGEIVIATEHIWIIGVSVLLMVLLFAFFRLSKVGLALTATAMNPHAAMLMGVNVPGMYGLSWALGSVLGAIGGVFIAPLLFLDVNFTHNLLIRGFAALVIGGMSSIPGAVVGGLLLGVLENVSVGLFSSELKEGIVFAIIMLMLFFKPTGLFERARKGKV